jgi:Na+(H+)/acetate symporter ActP
MDSFGSAEVPMNGDRGKWLVMEPVGIYILSLPVVLYLGFLLPEFGPGFFPEEGTSRGDVGSRFLALATLSGFVAGLLIVATGVGLLIPRLRRFTTGVSLMIAAGSAEVAMVAFALLGGLLGRSKGGLLEAYLLVIALPFAVVLLLLTVSGVWYLRRPAMRRALEGERDQRQGRTEPAVAADRGPQGGSS